MFLSACIRLKINFLVIVNQPLIFNSSIFPAHQSESDLALIGDPDPDLDPDLDLEPDLEPDFDLDRDLGEPDLERGEPDLERELDRDLGKTEVK